MYKRQHGFCLSPPIKLGKPVPPPKHPMFNSSSFTTRIVQCLTLSTIRIPDRHFVGGIQSTNHYSQTGLERILNEASRWTPHETAMTLGSLASHVALLSTWTSGMMSQNSLDISAATSGFLSPSISASHLQVALTEMSAVSDLY